MYSSKMSLKSFILVATFILYSANQASALQCYVCASTADGDCYKNPKQEQYKTDCSKMPGIPQFKESQFYRIGNEINNIFANYSSGISLGSILDFECVTILGELSNQKAVVRTCSTKIMTCELWKTHLQSNGQLRIQHCDQCQSDACNSSNHLSVGFLSLLGSLVTIMFIRM